MADMFHPTMIGRVQNPLPGIADGQVVSNEIGVIPPAIQDEAKRLTRIMTKLSQRTSTPHRPEWTQERR
jgi:hypothetical protein